MKTDSHKILITSAAVIATALLLAFQPASAFNPQPEPPADQAAPMTLPGEDRLTAPKPASVPKGEKAKGLSPGKPRAMDPGDDEMPAIKPRTMDR